MIDQKEWCEMDFEQQSRYIKQLQYQAQQSNLEHLHMQAAQRNKDAQMCTLYNTAFHTMASSIQDYMYASMNANLPYGQNPHGAQNAIPYGPYESDSMNQKLQAAKDYLKKKS